MPRPIARMQRRDTLPRRRVIICAYGTTMPSIRRRIDRHPTGLEAVPACVADGHVSPDFDGLEDAEADNVDPALAESGYGRVGSCQRLGVSEVIVNKRDDAVL
jgi:hypothetical protein